MFHGYVTNYQRVNEMLENISEVPTIYSNDPKYVWKGLPDVSG